MMFRAQHFCPGKWAFSGQKQFSANFIRKTMLFPDKTEV